jgi:3-hydroxyisobutyrate dehydrogenase-like beta-hydroxyacid dehydrogenase
MPARCVGIVGLGLLGQALARRLIAGGYKAAGFDLDAAKNTAFAQLGGEICTDAGVVAKHCDAVVLAVLNTEQVEQVVEREMLPGLGRASDKTVLCASTCDPDRISSLAERVEARGLHFLETPVSGSSGQVARGEGLGLIGGDVQTVARLEPVLRALFPAYVHVGKVGDGGRAKLAINLILGLNRLALAEGLVFAERLGLDPAAFLKEVARKSACHSQVMDVKGEKMVRGDFAAEGRLAQHLKDVQLMLEQAKRAGQELPLSVVHADVLQACVRRGQGDLDNSSVIEEVRRRRFPLPATRGEGAEPRSGEAGEGQ